MYYATEILTGSIQVECIKVPPHQQMGDTIDSYCKSGTVWIPGYMLNVLENRAKKMQDKSIII